MFAMTSSCCFWLPFFLVTQVQVPRAVQHVLDAAIQLHGGAGVCDDFPVARLWTAARTLRIADGPDEVHLLTIGRDELRKGKPTAGRAEPTPRL